MIVGTDSGCVEIWDVDSKTRIHNMSINDVLKDDDDPRVENAKSIYMSSHRNIYDCGFFTEHKDNVTVTPTLTHTSPNLLKFWTYDKSSSTFKITTTVRHLLQESTVDYDGRKLCVFGVFGKDVRGEVRRYMGLLGSSTITVNSSNSSTFSVSGGVRC